MDILNEIIEISDEMVNSLEEDGFFEEHQFIDRIPLKRALQIAMQRKWEQENDMLLTDKEFLEIPFFRKVNDFVYKLWDQCKQKKYIETPVLKRKIYKDSITNITANKLFNYYLQATETEISTVKLQQVLEYLRDKESKLVLYTYDSVLLDVNYSEAKQILPDVINIMQQGNFPVKVSAGNIYSKMNIITI